ncbi:MAG: APC family permease [Chloroflexi bacterium]|nr:MAG: APC family permease [Chloroflexota bacterium]
MSIESSSSSPGQSTLRPNAIGLPGVLFQSITTMAPASAVAFSLGAAIPFAGGALPLAVLIALLVCSLIALNIGSLARYLPSAGGYFTYVSRGLGSQAGWMTGWLFSLTYLLIVPLQLLVLGPVMDGFAQQYFHLSFGANGWAVWAMIFAVIIFRLTYFGIKISADTSVVMGAIEIGVFVLLSIWLIATAGNGNTAATFNPASSLESGLGGWQGILHGMIFAFLAFAGFESSAPLAEEAHNPRRTVPRAILLATVSIGVFYVFCSYAGVVGWGFNKISAYPNDPNPWGTLANRVWGLFAFVAILAILNSALANANAGVNAASRVLYAMGRTRTLPGPLAHISSRFRTPDTAIIFTMIVGVIFTLLPGFVYGAGTAFALLGTIITILILVVYMAACLAVPFFYRRERPQEFNALRHVLLPAIPFVVLIFPILAQFIPAPSPPLNLAAPICAAWFVLGLVIVILLSLRAPRALAQSNKVYLEDEPVLEEERSAG